MSRSLAKLLICLISTMAWADLPVTILAQDNVAIPAQEKAAPGNEELTSERLVGFVGAAVVVLFYTVVPYFMIFKSHESNNPNAFFGMGLILGSPLFAVLFGGLGFAIGYLIGVLFGDGQSFGMMGLALGGAGAALLAFATGVLFFLAGLCGWTGAD